MMYRIGCRCPLVEDDQVDAAGALRLVGELDDVFQRTAQPVKFGGHELIAGPVR